MSSLILRRGTRLNSLYTFPLFIREREREWFVEYKHVLPNSEKRDSFV